MKEGVTTTMKRRKELGAAAPLIGCCPLSHIYIYVYIGYAPLLS
jgi:hypothetical protein